MFGIGRRRSRADLVRAELGESLDHFMRAATHAATGVGATVGPRVTAARSYVAPAATRLRNTALNGWESTMTALAPLAVAVMDGARQAGTVAQKARGQNMMLMRNRTRAMRRNRSRMAGMNWSRMVGFLAAGAAVSAVAMAMRRRRQRQWEEYDPGHVMRPEGAEPMTSGMRMAPEAPTETSKMSTPTAAGSAKVSSSSTSMSEDRSAR